MELIDNIDHRLGDDLHDTGAVDVSAAFADSEPDDDDLPDPTDASIGGKVRIDLADMDLPLWQRELSEDLDVIAGLIGEMEKVSPADDAKLQFVKAQIDDKLATPINPGNRKVLIFTAFADTADYLYKHLAPALWQQRQLHVAERECIRLEAQLAREPQFNRKVEINRALHEAMGRLQALRSTAGQ